MNGISCPLCQKPILTLIEKESDDSIEACGGCKECELHYDFHNGTTIYSLRGEAFSDILGGGVWVNLSTSEEISFKEMLGLLKGPKAS